MPLLGFLLKCIPRGIHFFAGIYLRTPLIIPRPIRSLQERQVQSNTRVIELHGGIGMVPNPAYKNGANIEFECAIIEHIHL